MESKVSRYRIKNIDYALKMLSWFLDGNDKAGRTEMAKELGITKKSRITSYNVCYTKLLRL